MLDIQLTSPQMLIGKWLKQNSLKTWQKIALNNSMKLLIPFNVAHGFEVSQINAYGVTVRVPYRRLNFNHLKAIHACAIATSGEMSAGLTLAKYFGFNDYRLIMSKFEIDFHYQAKSDLYSHSKWSKREMDHALSQIKTHQKALISMKSEIHDKFSNHVATMLTDWQVKPWKSVKTKIN